MKNELTPEQNARQLIEKSMSTGMSQREAVRSALEATKLTLSTFENPLMETLAPHAKERIQTTHDYLQDLVVPELTTGMKELLKDFLMDNLTVMLEGGKYDEQIKVTIVVDGTSICSDSVSI